MKRFLLTVKNFITNDFIEIIATILMSAILELLRKVFVFLHDSTDLVELSSLKSIFDIQTADSLINIILLTLLIWGVTGLARIMEKENPGKRKKLSTLVMFFSFISCAFWYVFKVLLVLDLPHMKISLCFCLLLIVVLTLYFAHSSTAKDIHQTDHRIA